MDKGALEFADRVVFGLDLDGVNASDASKQNLKDVVDCGVREVLVDGGDVNRRDDRVFGQVQLGVLGGELVIKVGGVHFRLFVRLVCLCSSTGHWFNFMLSFFLEKRFQFLEMNLTDSSQETPSHKNVPFLCSAIFHAETLQVSA
jgi:hypothetical protein